MDTLIEHNINEYNKKEDTAYLFRKDHQLRGDVAIEMISEVIKKNKNQKFLSIACSIGVIEEKIRINCLWN